MHPANFPAKLELHPFCAPEEDEAHLAHMELAQTTFMRR
jgi:hypothetical protein